MVSKPTKYRASTAPIAAQPEMFGGPPTVDPPTLRLCEAEGCGGRGSHGFGLRGRALGAQTKFYCSDHIALGEAHWRALNE